ncbi:GNAT family N-acetyltransferase [Patescibacteria group bacterium]|nr:GNAT family N-acetyltransferase [Patescibacteria group bacterium]MBU0963882.1 GNAT family N-acetyltransferase [Patescibacteria group bacterium]
MSTIIRKEKDAEIEDFIVSKVTIRKKILRVFFKKLKSSFKFYFFNLWSSRKFSFFQSKSFNDLLKIYKLRYEVYCEEYNYLKSEDYPDNLEQDKYDPFSQHFAIKNGSEEIVGYVRLIFNSKHGFPIESEFDLNFGHIKIDREKTVEISRLIVSNEYRKLHLILLLVRGILNFAKDNNVKYAFSVMDDRLLKMLVKMKFPFRKIGPYTSYQGVTCPNILILEDLKKELRQKNKLLFNYLYK